MPLPIGRAARVAASRAGIIAARRINVRISVGQATEGTAWWPRKLLALRV